MTTTSAGELLHLVRTGQATTRKALQARTGLSRSTLTGRLDALQAAGWLAESGQEDSTGGRPARQLRFDDQHAVVLAASVDTMHAEAALTDLSGRRLARRAGALRVADGPVAVLDKIVQWFRGLLAESGRNAREACGIGLSVPGPVDFASGRTIQPPIMPGWDAFDIPAYLTERFGVPVFVDNDANLMALGTQRTHYAGCAAFALVKVSTGIGAGLIFDGQVYRGIDGGAGDIGHVRVPGDAESRCMCGSIGCLAAVASGGALAAKLTEAGFPTASGSSVRERVNAGEPVAVRLTRIAGRQVGEVLSTVVCVLNPGVLVLAGDLAEPHFATGVREVLLQRALPRATQRLRIDLGRRGDGAAVTGACSMVVENVFSAEAVDARLAAMR
ncbi:Sugar kinase of the NBD/HSP70 family, may contain an N-terminal HTH domain [Amycolatopsis xylanica]|uniref:Sugar kinase of the NBD/HSP70 family, may contain an N-terminal HTH domain n=1 Tax=Amycolatopsis xylanica TaxID=589385 RepID=A0A1H3NBJ8_9PSEU|nr:ROK family protein [Amycolatopsis xylanica]SDY86277.1 Sugar kinase of the NBD/HSP70 family, may contain an N-terminal HTH domain [Amycolatopsis xylanica]